MALGVDAAGRRDAAVHLTVDGLEEHRDARELLRRGLVRGSLEFDTAGDAESGPQDDVDAGHVGVADATGTVAHIVGSPGMGGGFGVGATNWSSSSCRSRARWSSAARSAAAGRGI